MFAEYLVGKCDDNFQKSWRGGAEQATYPISLSISDICHSLIRNKLQSREYYRLHIPEVWLMFLLKPYRSSAKERLWLTNLALLTFHVQLHWRPERRGLKVCSLTGQFCMDILSAKAVQGDVIDRHSIPQGRGSRKNASVAIPHHARRWFACKEYKQKYRKKYRVYKIYLWLD